ncbi:hypothetical protein L1887_23562 [Cichorium endivia]|nr:hypothetical protein L1887_23562 [Cichorium endivia]
MSNQILKFEKTGKKETSVSKGGIEMQTPGYTHIKPSFDASGSTSDAKKPWVLKDTRGKYAITDSIEAESFRKTGKKETSGSKGGIEMQTSGYTHIKPSFDAGGSTSDAKKPRVFRDARGKYAITDSIEAESFNDLELGEDGNEKTPLWRSRRQSNQSTPTSPKQTGDHGKGPTHAETTHTGDQDPTPLPLAEKPEENSNTNFALALIAAVPLQALHTGGFPER